MVSWFLPSLVLLALAMHASAHVLSVGCLLFADVNDHTWTYEHDFGIRTLASRAEYASIVSFQVVYGVEGDDGNADADQILSLCDELVSGGASLILSLDFTFGEGTSLCAEKYPQVKFLCVSCLLPEAENTAMAFGKILEPRYLNGLLAGAMTTAKKIGYVAPIRSPEVYGIINSFALGVRETSTDSSIHVAFTDSFADPRKALQATDHLLNLGCDIIVSHTNIVEVHNRAHESDAYSIGFYSNMEVLFGPQVLSSSRFSWASVFQRYIDDVLNNKWEGEFWEPGISQGAVQAIYPSSVVPENVVEVILEEQEKFNTEDFQIFCGDVLSELGIREDPVPEEDCATSEEMGTIDSLIGNCEIEEPAYYYNLLQTEWSKPGEIVLVIYTASVQLLTLIISVMVLLKADTPVIKISDTPFIFAMCAASVIGSTSGYFFLAPPSNFTCMAGYWFTYCSFAITLGCILLKNIRLMKIINGAEKLQRVEVPARQLVFVIMILEGIMIAILGTWTGLEEAILKPTWILSDSLPVDTAYFICDGEKAWIFILTINVVVSVILVMGVLISYKTRHFSKFFKESDKISTAVFLIFITEIILLPLIYTFEVNDYEVKALLLALVSVWRNFIPVALIMVPKLWIAYVHPEKNSADSFAFRPSSGSAKEEPGIQI